MWVWYVGVESTGGVIYVDRYDVCMCVGKYDVCGCGMWVWRAQEEKGHSIRSNQSCTIMHTVTIYLTAVRCSSDAI